MEITFNKIVQGIRHPKRSMNRLIEIIKDERGYASPPVSANILPTMMCNFKCRMCTVWRLIDTASDEGKQFISMDFIGKFVDDLSETSRSFTLIGGEPFIHPDWKEIVSYVKKKNHSCSVITNGWFLDKFAKDIIDSGLDTLDVSLDGREEINDINRKEGSYKKIVSGIRSIQSLKTELQVNHPTINIIATINDITYKYLSDLVEICNELNVAELRLTNLIYYSDKVLKEQHYEFKKNFLENSPLKPLKDYPEEFESKPTFVPDKINPEILIEEIRKIKNAKKKFKFALIPDYSDDEIMEYYNEDDYERPKDDICRIPYQIMTLLPNGFIEACMGYRVGNIGNDSTLHIWNNKYYRHFRRVFKKTGRLPICHRCCN